jgi:hypothetical protein
LSTSSGATRWRSSQRRPLSQCMRLQKGEADCHLRRKGTLPKLRRHLPRFRLDTHAASSFCGSCECLLNRITGRPVTDPLALATAHSTSTTSRQRSHCYSSSRRASPCRPRRGCRRCPTRPLDP